MESITISNELYTVSELKEIVYLESYGNFTKTYNCNGKDFLIDDDLKRIEKILPDEKFFRINDSSIINADYLKRVNVMTTRNVLLHNGIELKIAQNKYTDLMRFLKTKYNIW